MYKVVSYDKWDALPDIFMRFKDAKEAIKGLDSSYVIEDWSRGRAVVVWPKGRGNAMWKRKKKK